MCGFCAILGGSYHWSEFGTASEQYITYSNSQPQRLERLKQIKQINRVISIIGFNISDWANSKYLVRGPTGKTELADNLSHLWSVIEGISVSKIDPLDRKFLKQIESIDHDEY